MLGNINISLGSPSTASAGFIMAHCRTTLSILHGFDFFISLLKAIFYFMMFVLSVPFRSSERHPKSMKHVIHSALRVMNARTSAKEFQWVHPSPFHCSNKDRTKNSRNMMTSTDETYEAFAKANNFEPISTSLPEDATAHWIGSPDADRVLVVFHGGGIFYSAITQFQFVYDVQEKAGKNTAGVVLSYSLAPEKQYPHQLKQVIALISYLINEACKKPENIILVGDSAGANLILGVISHLLHPLPDPSIAPLHTATPLKGVALMTPMTNFNPTVPSYTTTLKKDFISQHVLATWGRYYMGESPPNAYSRSGPEGEIWWDGMDTKIGEVMLVTRERDIMFDGTQDFSDMLKVSLLTSLKAYEIAQ
ncbi:unnamed protein product [Periconia digitata]|uniref:Alpha/beta hydrolase fold-3 domain-containing protein n=1 Tax=Periconia digitata TaxID=1303443 RepID=A0A9W4UIY2_9PLEO|nr:unnamed protein product [Periconia digitata]